MLVKPLLMPSSSYLRCISEISVVRHQTPAMAHTKLQHSVFADSCGLCCSTVVMLSCTMNSSNNNVQGVLLVLTVTQCASGKYWVHMLTVSGLVLQWVLLKLHLLRLEKRKITILNHVSSILTPGRTTLLLGPPGGGKVSAPAVLRCCQCTHQGRP